MSTLPAGFEALAGYVDPWAAETATRRAELRGEVPADQRRAFYDAAAPLLDAALDHLDAKAFADYDEGERRLMRMMLSLAHVAMVEEVHKEQEPKHAAMRQFMPVTRAPSDF